MTSFTIKLTATDRERLGKIAEHEELTLANVLRLMIRREAKKLDQCSEHGTTNAITDKGGASERK